MDFDDIKSTRRQVVGGIATGAAAAFATPAMAQRTAGGGMPPEKMAGAPLAEKEQPMQNPVTEYPKPPFPEQQQPWPGLSAMTRARSRRGRAIRARDGLPAARRSSPAAIRASGVRRRSLSRAKAPMSRSTISPPRSRTRARSWR